MVASVRVSVAVLILLLVSASAFADTVRITVDRALVWNRPSGVAVVISQLTQDTVLEVVQKIGDWYEILLPRGAAGAETASGYIRASQVVVETVGPPSPDARRARTRPPVAPAGRASRGPSIFNLNGAYRAGQENLTRTVAAFTDRFAEEGSITSDYGTPSGVAVDLLYGQPIWGTIGIGLGAEFYVDKHSAAVEARIPHPFYFNQLRPATFDTAPLKKQEGALHIPVLWMPPASGSLKFLVYGGPSIFRLSQVVVSDLSLSDEYPHDTAAITGVITEDRNSTAFGFHAGADVSYFFTRSVGIGGGARYSHRTATTTDDPGTTTAGDKGAIQAVGGLRFRF